MTTLALLMAGLALFSVTDLPLAVNGAGAVMTAVAVGRAVKKETGKERQQGCGSHEKDN